MIDSWHELLYYLAIERVEVARATVGEDVDHRPGAGREMRRPRRHRRGHHGAGRRGLLLQEAGQTRPLPCVVRVAEVRAKAIEMLRPSAGDIPGLRNLFIDLPTQAIPDAEWKEFDAFGLTLRDIDRPEDLQN